MNSRGKFQTVRLFGPLGLLVIAIILSGCATTTAVELKPTVDHLPSVSKIPLSVGIYYSPELRSYKHKVAQPGSSCIGQPVLYVGQPSVILFERLFPMIFHSAVTLESRQTLLSSKPNLSLVIEPDIESIECVSYRTYTVVLTYHFTLYSPNGEPLAYWNVAGLGQSESDFWGGPDRTAGNAADLAMEDAASKIAIQFREIPAVKRLLQEKR